MPNLYARATALHNVGGRIDYISNPDRQEHLLAVCDGAADLLDGQFWSLLAQESQAAFEQFGKKTRTVIDRKTGKKREITLHCCEAREIVMALSNALFDRMEADEVAQILVDEFKEKLGLTVLVAVHDNKKECNKHAHIIFPERKLLDEPVIKVAERALFFDAQGKRRYKKSEILDEDKQLMPGCRIVKKGEIYEQRYFSTADEKYRQRAWLKNVKTNVILPLRNGKLKGDVEITEYDPNSGKLAQVHVGKVKNTESVSAREKKAKLEEYNQSVREFNALVDKKVLATDGFVTLQQQVVTTETAKKNSVLRDLINRLLVAIQSLQESRQRAAEPEKPAEEKKKPSLDAQIQAADDRRGTNGGDWNVVNSRMNWRLQGQLDKIQGTDFAKQDKAKYFAKKKPEGR